MKSFFKSAKGQSALEYLMTYGWALVVMIVVIAALISLDVFNLGSTTNTCGGFPSLIAYQRHSYDANGDFKFQFINGTGETITVRDLNASGNLLTFTDFNVSAGGSAIVAGSGAPPGASGRAYKMPVTIIYDILTTPVFAARASGTCLGKYQ